MLKNQYKNFLANTLDTIKLFFYYQYFLIKIKQAQQRIQKFFKYNLIFLDKKKLYKFFIIKYIKIKY